MGSSLPFIEIGAARGEADLCIVLMHGLGADGHDFADVAQGLCAAGAPRRWRFVLPHAPKLGVTINMGVRMPAWYDIISLSQPRDVNWETVERSQESIEALIEEEAPERLVLAGFSQGAAMALHVGLRRKSPVAGILMMSGYLLESNDHPCPAKKGDFPIGIFHGGEDPVVPFEAAKSAEKCLAEAGHHPEIKVYEGMDHAVCDEEIRDVLDWLVGVSGSSA